MKNTKTIWDRFDEEFRWIAFDPTEDDGISHLKEIKSFFFSELNSILGELERIMEEYEDEPNSEKGRYGWKDLNAKLKELKERIK